MMVLAIQERRVPQLLLALEVPHAADQAGASATACQA